MTGRAHSNLRSLTLASGARTLRRVGQWLSLWVWLTPALAIAQFEESNGIKVGEGRLHPYIGLEMRYDSAAGYFGANNTLGAELVDHIAPGLRYDLLSSQWTMNFDGRADYVRYLGAISPGSEKISRLQANGDLNLIYGRRGRSASSWWIISSAPTRLPTPRWEWGSSPWATTCKRRFRFAPEVEPSSWCPELVSHSRTLTRSRPWRSPAARIRAAIRILSPR